MRWIKGLLLAAPLIVALALNALMIRADHLHLYRERQHIAGYGFLFSTPWSWLIGRVWFELFDPLWREHHRTQWVRASMGYVAILWIPAALYSASLWLLFLVIGVVKAGGHPSTTTPTSIR